MSRPTYSAAVREAERLRGDLVEETPGRASREELARWADDPVGWDLEAGRDPTDYQQAVMESVAVNKRTAWRGCHAAGKEFVCGSLAIWAAYARRSLVLVVSATERQAVHQTMKEVRKAWRAARKAHGIGGELYQGSVRIGGEDRVVALTGSANVDALTGWHDHENGVVVLISEGQGERLEAAAYDAAEGNVTTEQGRILAAGNPVRPSGRFYEIHQRSSWERFRTSAFDTPNVKAGEVVRPGFPAPDWPQDVAREYGEDSPFYQGRVLGEFPETSEDSLVKRSWLDRSTKVHREGALDYFADGADVVVGLDPSHKGPDATAAAIRQGRVVREIRTWTGEQTTQDVVEQTHKLLAELTGPAKPRVRELVVDSVGVGSGPADLLEASLRGRKYHHAPISRGRHRPPVRESVIRVTSFNSGRAADDSERFFNVRSAIFWAVREHLEDTEFLILPEDEKLIEELTKLRWSLTGRQAVKIEPKDDLKSRLGGRSPDTADALALTFASEVVKSGKEFWFR